MQNRAKNLLTLILTSAVGVFGEVAVQGQSGPQILDRGPHQQRIEYHSRKVTESGEEQVETNSYVQIQTGLNRWDEAQNGYVLT